MRTLLLDNYDSFTFNLYHLIAEVNGVEPVVVRNDELSWAELRQLPFDNIVISPGPGRPENERDFGICGRVLLECEVPLLGVCLGHQGLAYFHGAQIEHAPEPVHGRLSPIFHNGSALFAGMPQGFQAVRYHSLAVAKPLPDCLEGIAWTTDGVIMALRHRERPLWGVQFHPESISTKHGKTLLENFRRLTKPRCHLAATPSVRSRAPRPAVATLHSRKLDLRAEPEAAFSALYGASPYAFWLDSSLVRRGLSRFSFIGEGAPHVEDNVFDFLKADILGNACASTGLPFDFNCGYVGYFGYELKAQCGGARQHIARDPDSVLLFADRLIAFDHAEAAVYLVFLGNGEAAAKWFRETEERLRAAPSLDPVSPAASQAPYRLADNKDEYLRKIDACLDAIREGQTYQVCLTNRLHCRTEIDPFRFYRLLRRISPAPYSAFLRLGALSIACSSPERFLKIDPSGRVESKPIKGTAPRGASPRDDARLRNLLRADPKNRSENLMIADLLRNDLGRVCQTGTVHVPKLMDVETYATVHQMVSTVRGRLRQGVTAVDCLRSCFPGGSMTGAPKLRTMEIIDALETSARGIYSGCLGFLGLNGSADLNIVIRTAVFHPGEVTIGTGGAIVALSDPAAEFDETLLKAQALLRVLDSAPEIAP